MGSEVQFLSILFLSEFHTSLIMFAFLFFMLVGTSLLILHSEHFYSLFLIQCICLLIFFM